MTVLDKRLRLDRDQEADTTAEPWSARSSAADDGSGDPAARRQVEAQMQQLARGPFRTEVNDALAQSFGADLSGLSASFGDGESTRRLGAAAYTRGPHMVFGPDIRDDPGDRRSMEVIGHEVAHALGTAGTGTAVDRPDGVAETAAADTGQRFAGWMARGREGRAPALQPVPGEAAIHRFSVGGPGGMKDPVHEELTLQTLVRAGVVSSDAALWDPETIEYLRGVYWNDDPESKQFRDPGPNADGAAGIQFATGIRWLLTYLFGDPERNLTARSHHGDLQFLHAMAGKDGEPPEVTRGNAGRWARFTVEVALGTIAGDTQMCQTELADLFAGKLATMSIYGLFGMMRPEPGALRQRATGSLLHLVQDSHAHGHTERNQRGEIVEFHAFTGQDHDEHAEYDAFHGRGGTVDSVPGGAPAIDHGVRVLELLRGGDPERVVAFVMNEVLRLAPDARPAGAGDALAERRRADHMVAPEGFAPTGHGADDTVDFRARLPAADGREVTFILQIIRDQPGGGERWILWQSGKLGALAWGNGRPTTPRLYLELNPALGYPAGTLPLR